MDTIPALLTRFDGEYRLAHHERDLLKSYVDADALEHALAQVHPTYRPDLLKLFTRSTRGFISHISDHALAALIDPVLAPYWAGKSKEQLLSVLAEKHPPYPGLTTALRRLEGGTT